MKNDLFVSYARSDNDAGWVDAFVSSLASTCKKLTGVELRIFIDRGSIRPADLWENKIGQAVDGSLALLAIVSPSFVTSEWCRREWRRMEIQEGVLRANGLLPQDQGLIVPVLLHPLSRGRFSAEQSLFASDIQARQVMDVSSQSDTTPIRAEQIKSLAEQILDITAEVEARSASPVVVRHEPSSVILDTPGGLIWAGALSPSEMTYEDAVAYVRQLSIGGVNNWRLPTAIELENLILESERQKDPLNRSASPLRPPFNALRFGRLHSSTPISQSIDQHYVMNVQNGHVFNGSDGKAFVRAVTRLTYEALEVLARETMIENS